MTVHRWFFSPHFQSCTGFIDVNFLWGSCLSFHHWDLKKLLWKWSILYLLVKTFFLNDVLNTAKKKLKKTNTKLKWCLLPLIKNKARRNRKVIDDPKETILSNATRMARFSTRIQPFKAHRTDSILFSHHRACWYYLQRYCSKQDCFWGNYTST